MELLRLQHNDTILYKLQPTRPSSSRSSTPIQLIFLLEATHATTWIWPTLIQTLTSLEATLPSHPRISLTKIASATRLKIIPPSPNAPALLPHHAYAYLDQSRHDIYFAFSAVQLHIASIRRQDPATVFYLVYVSDGHDDDPHNPRLDPCLRQLASFDPTGVFMTTIACKPRFADAVFSDQLRVSFTDPSIPNYLPPLTVANSSEQFSLIFARLVPKLLLPPPLKCALSRPVTPLPCEAHNHDQRCIIPETWFVCEHDARTKPILVDKTPVPVRDVPLTLDSFHEMARQSIRDLQATYLFCAIPDGASRQIFSNVALSLLQELDTRLQPSQASKINIDTAFADRLERFDTKEKDDLLFELACLSYGAYPVHDYTLERMARRFAVGYPRAPDSVSDKPEQCQSQAAFLAARKSFGEVLERQLPLLKRAADNDPFKSAISWETNIDILTDKSLLQNLFDPRFCSQQTLLDCLPVVGLAVNTYLPPNAAASPWLVRVESMSRLTPILDTASLSDMMNHRNMAFISSGTDQYELINTICPVMTPDTTPALCPILLSRLYQMAMSFQITRNVGTVDRSTHLALLASTLTYLLNEPKTGWRSEQIDSVIYTADALIEYSAAMGKSGGNGKTHSFVDRLIENPAMAVAETHPNTSRKCQTISKALIAVAVAMRRKDSRADWAIIWKRIVAEYVGRAVGDKESKRDITKWFIICGMVTKTTLQFEDIFGEDENSLSSYNSVNHVLRTVAMHDLRAEDIEIIAVEIKSQFERLEHVENSSIGPVKWSTLEAFEDEFSQLPNITADEETIRSFVVHAFSHKGSYERACHEIKPWTDRVKKKLFGILERSSQRIELQRMSLEALKQRVSGIARDKMLAYMKKTHAEGIVLPLSLKELKQRRKAIHGLDTSSEDLEKLGYDSGRGLCRFACQNETCPRFLLPDRRISEHLANAGADAGRPVIALHRTVQRHYTKSVADIERLILRGACIARGDRKLVVEQIASAYRTRFRRDIAALREAYKNLSVVRRFSSSRRSHA